MKNSFHTLDNASCPRIMERPDLSRGYVDCHGLLKCKPGFVYPIADDERTMGVRTGCFLPGINSKQGVWKAVVHTETGSEARDLSDCIQGKLILNK